MASITKRGNTYRIVVSCGYDINNKKITHSMTYKPAPNMTEKQIQKDLQKQALMFEEKCKNGLVSNNPNLTFADFVPQYLSIKKDTLSPHTYEKYERILNKYVIPKIGHLKLSAIKPIHIQNFIKNPSETPCQKKHTNSKILYTDKKHSPSTVKRYLTIVQSVLSQAVKLELIPVNPANAEKLNIPKSVKPKVEIFTKQEAIEMLTYLQNEPLQFQVLIQLAIMTGARRGELVALKFSDIDYTTNKVTIERSAVKVTGQPIAIKPPKDYEIRSVTISPILTDLIKQLEQEKKQEALKLGDQWQEADWLFTQWNGDIMNPQTPTKWFSKFLDKNNLKHRKFHSLRHTSATLLLYGGVNIKQVQGRLGHGNIETTNKYLHYISEADEEASNVLQDMLITHKSNNTTDKKKMQCKYIQQELHVHLNVNSCKACCFFINSSQIVAKMNFSVNKKHPNSSQSA